MCSTSVFRTPPKPFGTLASPVGQGGSIIREAPVVRTVSSWKMPNRVERGSAFIYTAGGDSTSWAELKAGGAGYGVGAGAEPGRSRTGSGASVIQLVGLSMPTKRL